MRWGAKTHGIAHEATTASGTPAGGAPGATPEQGAPDGDAGPSAGGAPPPVIRLLAGRAPLSVTPGGLVRVRLAAFEQDLAVTARLRRGGRLLGEGDVIAHRGRTSVVAIRLNGPGRRYLRRHRGTTARLTIAVRTPQLVTVNRTFLRRVR